MENRPADHRLPASVRIPVVVCPVTIFVNGWPLHVTRSNRGFRFVPLEERGLAGYRCESTLEMRLAQLLQLLSVFVLGAAELWAAIPAGLAMGLSGWTVGLVSASGAITGAVVVAALGDRVRAWILKRHETRHSAGEEPSRARRIWDRFGSAGLGLSAPMITGAPLAIALGITLGAPTKRLLAWTTVGILVWTAVLTAVGVVGREGIAAAMN